MSKTTQFDKVIYRQNEQMAKRVSQFSETLALLRNCGTCTEPERVTRIHQELTQFKHHLDQRVTDMLAHLHDET